MASFSDGSPSGSPSDLDRAAFVVSIDTELAWGLVHRPREPYRYDDERPDLERLVALFDRYEIPATWAVVGHLMLESCRPVDGVKHPEIVRPEYDWFDGDWFDADPCTDAEHDPTWYAPDIVEMIRSATVEHEIASHGFSHVFAGEPGCTAASFDSELAAAVAVAESKGISLRSIIHPRNGIDHLDLLPKHGFETYRGRRPRPAGPGSPLDRLIDAIWGSERTAVRPIDEGDLWNLPATIMFDIDGRGRTLPLWLRQVTRRLDQSVKRRSLFHLWFHPHNLRDRPDEAFRALERIFAAAAEHRSNGGLDTVTMAGLADRLGQRTS